ncbi:hypothetical protein HPB50_005525 [Hyalomma asiaticum]|uniref:Uncharacterized protein n=1 Tax=Hyalomma asiaticum TaxID=266040 RepID=A0ACB7TD21_HYAAI|nr:hypothetical protein HPB50_005525 [Hyalomma asiaticum]
MCGMYSGHYGSYSTYCGTKLAPGLKRCQQLDDCTLQLYKINATDNDYGSYLDLESTIDEQGDDFEGFQDNREGIQAIQALESFACFVGATEIAAPSAAVGPPSAGSALFAGARGARWLLRGTSRGVVKLRGKSSGSAGDRDWWPPGDTWLSRIR